MYIILHCLLAFVGFVRRISTATATHDLGIDCLLFGEGRHSRQNWRTRRGLSSSPPRRIAGSASRRQLRQRLFRSDLFRF